MHRLQLLVISDSDALVGVVDAARFTALSERFLRNRFVSDRPPEAPVGVLGDVRDLKVLLLGVVVTLEAIGSC